MVPSRKIEDLIPEMQEKAKNFAVAMASAGIPFMFTCTFRSQEDQDVLYQKGRSLPGPIVTWTHNSRHTQRDAFDIAILSQGKPVWDTKVDVDKDGVADYAQAGEIGKTCGLEWGGDWKTNKDYPHFQNKVA